MRVAVTGGRKFDDRKRLFDALDRLHDQRQITMIIHGGASGSDTLASEWAMLRRVRCYPIRAKWKLHGKAAGPIRNQEMIDIGKPELLVQCKGGKGTADMTRRAQSAGLPIVKVGIDDELLSVW